MFQARVIATIIVLGGILAVALYNIFKSRRAGVEPDSSGIRSTNPLV